MTNEEEFLIELVDSYIPHKNTIKYTNNTIELNLNVDAWVYALQHSLQYCDNGDVIIDDEDFHTYLYLYRYHYNSLTENKNKKEKDKNIEETSEYLNRVYPNLSNLLRLDKIPQNILDYFDIAYYDVLFSRTDVYNEFKKYISGLFWSNTDNEYLESELHNDILNSLEYIYDIDLIYEISPYITQLNGAKIYLSGYYKDYINFDDLN